MPINKLTFHLHNVTDTCAVWNVLSSTQLYKAAINAKVDFCITSTVLYECLCRAPKTQEDVEMIKRLETARNQNKFPVIECDLEDLSFIASKASRKLNSGELSCIAVTYKEIHKEKNIVFMTDEKAARKFAENELQLDVQTTPKLYAWLHFYRHLIDSDHRSIIDEHENFEKEIPLTKFFEIAYQEAMRCKFMAIAKVN